MGTIDEKGLSHELRPGVKPPLRRDAQFHPLPPREQKRSFAVPLIALGGATLVGLTMLGHGQDVQRNRYDNYEDCVHDYSSGQCEIDTSVSNPSSGLHYYGPWYRSGGSGGNGGGANDPGPGRAMATGGRVSAAEGFSGPRGVELGTRGGFGSTGRISARAS